MYRILTKVQLELCISDNSWTANMTIKKRNPNIRKNVETGHAYKQHKRKHKCKIIQQKRKYEKDMKW